MDFLSQIYSDKYYESCLSTSPAPGVRVYGASDEVTSPVRASLELSDSGGGRMRVFNKVSTERRVSRVETESGVFLPSDDLPRGDSHDEPFLRCDWCYNAEHVHGSCIILAIHMSEINMEEIMLVDVKQQLVVRMADVLQRMFDDDMRVVVACLTNEDVDEAGVEKRLLVLQASVAELLDKHLEAFVHLRASGASGTINAGSARALHNTVLQAIARYHQRRIALLKEERSLIMATHTLSPRVFRVCFQLAWNYLMLRESANARRFFESSYKAMRALCPVFASLEARVCGSICMHHVLALATHVRPGTLEPQAALFRDIQLHVEWVSQPFRRAELASCTAVSVVLSSLLAAQWLQTLVSRATTLDERSGVDIRLSACSALARALRAMPERQAERAGRSGEEQFVNEVESSGAACLATASYVEEGDLHIFHLLERKTAIAAPVYLGGECREEGYSEYIMQRVDKQRVLQRITQLTTEALSLGANTSSESLVRRVKYVKDRSRLFIEAALPSSSLLALDTGPAASPDRAFDATQRAPHPTNMHALFHKNYLERGEAQDACTRCRVLRSSPHAGSALIGPSAFRPATLTYPFANFRPPLDVCVAFSSLCCTVHGKPITAAVKIRSMCVRGVAELKGVVLGLQLAECGRARDSMDGVAAEMEKCHVDVRFSATALLKPGDEFVARARMTFGHSGTFVCDAVQADVVMDGAQAFVVRMHAPLISCALYAGLSSSANGVGESSSLAAQLPVLARVVVYEPTLSTSIKLPPQIHMVEGEVAEVSLHIDNAHASLTGGRLQLPYLPDLLTFSVVRTGVPSSEATRHSSISCPSATTSNRVSSDTPSDVYLPLPDVAAGVTSVVHLRVTGLTAGVYDIPVMTRFHASSSMLTEAVAYTRVTVKPPFSFFCTYTPQIQWANNNVLEDDSEKSDDSSATLSCARPLPLTSLQYTQSETLALKQLEFVDQKCARSRLNVRLFYHVQDEESAKHVCIVNLHEEFHVMVQLTCNVPAGLYIHQAEIMLDTSTFDLIDMRVGDVPCFVEEGESVQFLAQIRVSSAKGEAVPGYVRVRFSARKQLLHEQHQEQREQCARCRLVADYILPRVYAAVPLVTSRLSFPATVQLSVPFMFTITIASNTSTPFDAQCVIDNTEKNKYMIYSMQTRSNFVVAAHDSFDIQLRCVPIVLGRVPLPSFWIRSTRHSRLVAHSTDTRFVTVIAAEPSA